jgi:hypothetical protein
MRLKPHWAPFGLGFLGIGKKIDTIDWARSEIAETAAGLETGRKRLRDDIASEGTEDDFYPPLNSAFIYFHQQIAAHMAEQILLHHKPYSMSSAYIEQSPEDVVWFNLNLGSYQLSLRRAVSIAVTAGVIAVWAIPVAFIGALANVAGLVKTYPWMSWLLGTSGAKRLLQGVITGILPPVLLALVNQFLPSLLRCEYRLTRLIIVIITFQGIPTKKAVELKLMTRYFVFLVVVSLALAYLTIEHILCRNRIRRYPSIHSRLCQQSRLDPRRPVQQHAQSVDLFHHAHPDSIHRHRGDIVAANHAGVLLSARYLGWRYTVSDASIELMTDDPSSTRGTVCSGCSGGSNSPQSPSTLLSVSCS